jgi:GGDEF domain-containing protein
LQNYNTFRDGYGFVASDDMLRAVTLMITNAVRKEGKATDFIGHLNQHQFLVVTTPTTLDGLQRRLESRFDQNLDYFYPLEDQEGQKVEARKRLALSIQTLVPGRRKYKSIQAIKDDILNS